MKEIVPKDSRYVPFTQQRYCCAPACILMIMYRRGIPLVPQELLGHHLGLVVPKEVRGLFWNVHAAKQRPPAGYGTRASEPRYSAERAFRKLKIPLKETFHPLRNFDDGSFRKFLKAVEREDRDVLVCFDQRVLSGERKTKRGYRQGHLCVIDRVDLKNDAVRLIDPSVKQPKWRTVKIGNLKRAMEWHWPGSAGFWEFTNRDHKKHYTITTSY